MNKLALILAVGGRLPARFDPHPERYRAHVLDLAVRLARAYDRVDPAPPLAAAVDWLEEGRDPGLRNARRHYLRWAVRMIAAEVRRAGPLSA